MKKTSLNTKGFGALGVFLIVLAVAVVGFSGWLVWHKNHDTKKTATTTNTSNKGKNDRGKTTDETASWATVTTQGGAFSMKVPDGWNMVRYPDNYIGSSNVTYQKGKLAEITASNTEYAGDGLLFHASMFASSSTNLSPQWQSPQTGLEESQEDFSIGNLQGKRFKATFADWPDSTLYVYEYEFNLENNKHLSILYNVYPHEGDIDNVATVEKAIKTIKFN